MWPIFKIITGLPVESLSLSQPSTHWKGTASPRILSKRRRQDQIGDAKRPSLGVPVMGSGLSKAQKDVMLVWSECQSGVKGLSPSSRCVSKRRHDGLDSVNLCGAAVTSSVNMDYVQHEEIEAFAGPSDKLKTPSPTNHKSDVRDCEKRTRMPESLDQLSSIHPSNSSRVLTRTAINSLVKICGNLSYTHDSHDNPSAISIKETVDDVFAGQGTKSMPHNWYPRMHRDVLQSDYGHSQNITVEEEENMSTHTACEADYPNGHLTDDEVDDFDPDGGPLFLDEELEDDVVGSDDEDDLEVDPEENNLGEPDDGGPPDPGPPDPGPPDQGPPDQGPPDQGPPDEDPNAQPADDRNPVPERIFVPFENYNYNNFAPDNGEGAPRIRQQRVNEAIQALELLTGPELR